MLPVRGGGGGGRKRERVAGLPVCVCVCVCPCVRGSVSVCVLTPGARPPSLTLWRALCLSGSFFTALSFSLPLSSLLFPPSIACFLSALLFLFGSPSYCLPLSVPLRSPPFCSGSPSLWCRIFIAQAEAALD